MSPARTLICVACGSEQHGPVAERCQCCRNRYCLAPADEARELLLEEPSLGVPLQLVRLSVLTFLALSVVLLITSL